MARDLGSFRDVFISSFVRTDPERLTVGCRKCDWREGP